MVEYRVNTPQTMRRRLWLWILAGLLLSACSSLTSAEQVQRGQRLYNQHCASCHGLQGEGQYPTAPYKPDKEGLIGAPPHNAAGHTWHHPEQVLFNITKNGLIIKGFQPMPAFDGKLTDDEIRAVLAYIKTWWKPEQIEFQTTVSARYTPPAP
jgi:mono/diheme cytochrome c family protein